MLAFTLWASAPIRQGQTRSSGLIRWTEGRFGLHAKEPPVFKEPGGADWQHPAAMSRGSMGKMGRSEKEFEFLWLLHPAAAVLRKKRLYFPPSVSLPKFILETSCEWNWINWSRAEAMKANAVAEGVTRVYMKLSLVALLICSELTLPLFLTTQSICLLVGPPPQFFHVPLLWQMIQTARHWLALLCKHVTPAGYR